MRQHSSSGESISLPRLRVQELPMAFGGKRRLSPADVCAEWTCGMDYWLFLGLLLAGCAVGALLMAVVYVSQLRKVKSDLQAASGNSRDRSPMAPDPKHSEPQEVSVRS